jgi:hypothetical protein
MKPFYQGKLDVFCAVYAVLNGLRLTHGLLALAARDILHDTLLGLAGNAAAFRAVLEQRTDYHPLVDAMLQAQSVNYPMNLRIPFNPPERGGSVPSREELRSAVAEWLDGALRRAVIFRFFRHLTPSDPPVNRHWSVISHIEDGRLKLYDASHEPEAIQHIAADAFVTRPEDIGSGALLYIEPHSLRFIGKR